MTKSDAELLARDVKLTAAQRLEYLEDRQRDFEERIAQLTFAVKLLLHAPPGHALSAEESEKLKTARESL